MLKLLLQYPLQDVGYWKFFFPLVTAATAFIMPGSLTILQRQDCGKIKYSVEYHLNYVYFTYLNCIPLLAMEQNDTICC